MWRSTVSHFWGCRLDSEVYNNQHSNLGTITILSTSYFCFLFVLEASWPTINANLNKIWKSHTWLFLGLQVSFHIFMLMVSLVGGFVLHYSHLMTYVLVLYVTHMSLVARQHHREATVSMEHVHILLNDTISWVKPCVKTNNNNKNNPPQSTHSTSQGQAKPRILEMFTN